MIQQSTLTVESTEVIPTDSRSFKNISPDHTHKLRKAQDGHERRVVNNTARLAQANEQLRREIKEHRYAEEQLLNKQPALRRFLDLRDRQMVSCGIDDGLVRHLVAAIMQLRTFNRLAGRV